MKKIKVQAECWDCEKDLGEIEMPEEIAKTAPRLNNGKKLVICKSCSEAEDLENKKIQ